MKLDKEKLNLLNTKKIKVNEQDNILDHWVFLTSSTYQQALMWYTRKNDMLGNEVPRDLVEGGLGWQVMNLLSETRSRISYNAGFDAGVPRGRQEILKEIDALGIVCNIKE